MAWFLCACAMAERLRGFARSRSSFDLAIQDLTGVFHTLSLDDVASITDEKTSHMAAVKASADELRDVDRVPQPTDRRTTRRASPRSRAFGTRELISAGSSIRRPASGRRSTETSAEIATARSPAINKSNVSKLSVKWTFSIPLWSLFHPDTPYYRQNMQVLRTRDGSDRGRRRHVRDGPNQVFALDPRTGHQIWHYSRPRSTDLVSDPSLGTNRGVAVLGDHVFMVTDNAHLIALNRVTGRPVWEVVMPDEAQKYGGTMAPLIVKDMVIAGVSGGDWGIRGFLAAYKADDRRTRVAPLDHSGQGRSGL